MCLCTFVKRLIYRLARWVREVRGEFIHTFIETVCAMNENLKYFHHRLIGYFWGLLELAIRYHQGVVIDKVVLEHTGWVELVTEVECHAAR